MGYYLNTPCQASWASLSYTVDGFGKGLEPLTKEERRTQAALLDVSGAPAQASTHAGEKGGAR